MFQLKKVSCGASEAVSEVQKRTKNKPDMISDAAI